MGLVYSQNNEQEIICDYFAGNLGKLLDIGAHDGKEFSNSLSLIEAGWSAVLVEPNPSSMAKLVALHRANKSVTLVNAAVTVEQYLLMEFWASDTAASTTIEAFKEAWEAKHALQFAPMMIPPITTKTLIQFTGPVDYVTIDVEDSSLTLAVSMQDYLAKASLICIEHSSCGLSCADSLNELFTKQLTFRLIGSTPENFIFAK